MSTSSTSIDVHRQIVLPAIEEVRDDVPGGLDDDPDTRLLGEGAALDSLGLVTLLVAVEERLEAESGRALRLVNEKAMSQRRSPFRTIGSLVAYIEELLAEA